MREDEITIEGVTLTTAAAEEVLAWWDHKREVSPANITLHSRLYIVDGKSEAVPLTHAVIEQLRDHCFPWVEVRRDEVNPGEVFISTGRRFTAIGNSCGLFNLPRGRPHISEGKDLGGMHSTHTVLVRRPRRPALTLQDVEPGTLVMLDGFRHRVLEDYEAEQTGHVRAARVDTWEAHRWRADTPVELVEDES